ncbi:hypothetical protein PENFLA_c010G08294 [Penicillium flavigenum]|uniref:HNH nuclease domain-containing protein n=1 Tax=Penicillium flavigenum TaxID=254877 RepID=A0A1V6TCJ6_9EURO|nr:hypothetical protein PENFLA_c010G08294 [Penicillium flavigenum]
MIYWLVAPTSLGPCVPIAHGVEGKAWMATFHNYHSSSGGLTRALGITDSLASLATPACQSNLRRKIAQPEDAIFLKQFQSPRTITSADLAIELGKVHDTAFFTYADSSHGDRYDIKQVNRKALLEHQFWYSKKQMHGKSAKPGTDLALSQVSMKMCLFYVGASRTDSVLCHIGHIQVLKTQRSLIVEDIDEKVSAKRQRIEGPADQSLLEHAYRDAIISRVLGASAKQKGSNFDQSKFTKDVYRYYGVNEYCRPGFGWCHVLGTILPKKNIKAAHLVLKSLTFREVSHLFGVSDGVLGDPRNGITLADTIELLFDQGTIAIVPMRGPMKSPTEWRCVVLDESKNDDTIGTSGESYVRLKFQVHHWPRLSSHPRHTVYAEWSDPLTAPPEAQNEVDEPAVESILETPAGPANAPAVGPVPETPLGPVTHWSFSMSVIFQ